MNLGELKAQAIGLDDAEERSIFTSPGPNAMTQNPILIEKHKAIWNTTKDKCACIASQDYNVLRHQDFVNSIADGLARLNIKSQAHIKNGKNRVIVDINFPDAKIDVMKGETFTGGIRLVNSYDKSTGVIIAPRLTRLVCMNGMTMDVKGFVKTFHVHHTSERVLEIEKVADQMIKEIINSSEKLKLMLDKCIGDSVEWGILDKIAPAIFSVDKHREGIMQILAEKRRTGSPCTRWDFYNAVTQYISRGESLSANLDMLMQMKAQRILTTPFERLPVIEMEVTK